MGKKVTDAADCQPQGNIIFLKRDSGPGFPLALFLLLALVLLAAVFMMVQNSLGNERERMLEYMKNRADVLIWTLEGSARTLSAPRSGREEGHGRRRNEIYVLRQLLLEQAALQPAVEYIAICNDRGRILAHNLPEQVGEIWYSPSEIQAWSGAVESNGRYVERNGKRIFEVVKPFTPRRLPLGVRGDHRRRGNHSIAAPEGNGLNSDAGRQEEGQADTYILIGLDSAPFEAVLNKSARTAVITAAAVAFAGLSCLGLIFLIRHFRASRRNYHNTRALSFQVFNNLPLGLLMADRNGVVLLYNRHAAAMLGLPERMSEADKPDKAQKPFGLVDYPVLDWQGLQTQLERGEVIVDRELEMVCSGRPPVPVNLSAALIKDYQGKNAGYIYILRDLKELNRLREQVRRGERLSALGNLAAGVAHEIRNPLSALKGYVAWLGERLSLSGENDDAYAKTALSGPESTQSPETWRGLLSVVELMNDEVERLNRVVSELLGVARAGQLNLQEQNLLEVVQRAVRLAGAEAEQKQVKLALSADSGAEPPMAMLDKDKMLQALLNIIINAVQASPCHGSVRLSVAPETDSGGGQWWRVSVEDDGPGMSYEVQSKLFTPYFTTRPEGTGLGLAITNHIVEQHKGRLGVFSLPGKGSRFSIVLPFAR